MARIRRWTFKEALAFIEPFIEGGFFALVRNIDGSGDIVRSIREVSIGARSIVLFRPVPGRWKEPGA